MKFVEVEEIVASGTPAELLAGGENAPHMRIGNHPVWRAALAGELRRRRRIRWWPDEIKRRDRLCRSFALD